MKGIFSFLMAICLMVTFAFAKNYTVSGVVKDQATGEKLIGANVILMGTTIGAATDVNGEYKITAGEGNYTIRCSYVGYSPQELDFELSNNTEIDFSLENHEYTLSVTILADRVKERETPVAYSNIDKKEIQLTLGSRDIPMALNTTPSVYSTAQGGGAGDARINIRGFNQRNVAVMINGIPVNDMENGWVYWSNWDGVGDAARDMEVQRGLSAINLAVASIGGTMNIITSPANQKFGLKLKQEIGNDAFSKTSFFANTGLVNNTWALSLGLVKKVGDGYVDKTWTDAYAYYLSGSYNINKNNILEVYAVGAPQRHGQNSYRQNIAAYDGDFAKDLDDYDQGAYDKYYVEGYSGRKYNQNWSPLNTNYNGKQYFNGSTHDRYSSSFINERENYYHKPQVNLNWYSNFSKKVSFFTSLYYSGGKGGGSGTLGSMEWDYNPPSRRVDWDATIAENIANGSDGSSGILRNSVNEQYTIGAIAKTIVKLTDNINWTTGIDVRTSEIDHFREVRDLLGGSFYEAPSWYSSEFWTGNDNIRGLGDKIDYYNTNKVNWLGGYTQLEYSYDAITLYGSVGLSSQKYDYTDHFRKAMDNDGNKIDEKLHFETDVMTGYQLKTGASYRINDELSVFGNLGYMSKVPIFDNVIDDANGILNEDPENEIIAAVEAGINYRTRKLTFMANVYYSSWKDRGLTRSRSIETVDGSETVLYNISGLNQTHMGIEFEGAYQFNKYLRLDIAGSIGNWEYVDDVNARFSNIDADTGFEDLKLYIDGLKVGDAPQTQLATSLTVYPVSGFRARLDWRSYANFYAEFEPDSRTEEDRTQSWKTPNYNLFDFHMNYQLPFDFNGLRFELFAHVFNLFDEVYISDAVDNSRYNGFDGDHDADDAEVFFGLPRTFNLGISINY